jgi:CheY-like chemotaxis protein
VIQLRLETVPQPRQAFSGGRGLESRAQRSGWAGDRRIGEEPGGAVLLVEDDSAMAAMYRHRLERDGHVVTVARDGEEALRLARTLAHDIIVLDIGLPRRSGLEVMRLLRQDPATRDLPMAILSNYNEPSMVAEAGNLGALAFMVKADVTPGALARAIAGWLNG